ncbi:hypothetical protein [Actinoplanes sp. NPDC020271]|uniref:hypothetical protein n=1 Tax=Actinoplanes sp. NPDC020271 TaxID=3363896 RepID=UPI0037AFB9DB
MERISADQGRGRPGAAGVRLALVYLIGSVALPVGAFAFVSLLFGGAVVAGFVVLVLLAATVTCLYVVATATKDGSAATATPAGRLGWAVVVTLGGALGLAGAAGLTAMLHVRYGRPEPWFLLGGLPFLLVAALFIGRWIRVVAFVLVVALAGGAVYAVQRQHAETEQNRVLGMLQDPLDLIYTTDIPGYQRRTPPLSARTPYEPIDQSTVAYWLEKDIVVTVSHTAVTVTDCGPEPLFVPEPPPVLRQSDGSFPSPSPRPSAPPGPISCEADGGALFYRHGAAAHEYIRTDGTTVIRAAAGTVVDKELLRAAVLAAHAVNVDELEDEVFNR